MGVYLLDKDIIAFPDPSLARSDGLLAVGGDLSVDRLLLAYRKAYFLLLSFLRSINWEGNYILWFVSACIPQC